MKRTIGFLGTAVAFVLFVLFAPGDVCADNIFLPEIEKAVDQAIPAWIRGDANRLSAALEKLTQNEAYALAIGKSPEEGYLGRIPRSLNKDFNAVAAYLFLIRKEREGISLWPKCFFEGQRFEFNQTGER